ncbi:uncharacterized protein [Dasypus novemcinctus]|uniref:uncharacterized protein n=1 Tax=Dasypus novemcinctus TaxID=9361 RepID=UPI00265EDD61|nr:uncharacterized protein LOC131279947 isoform X1 [Dasypus novemcinctus]
MAAQVSRCELQRLHAALDCSGALVVSPSCRAPRWSTALATACQKDAVSRAPRPLGTWVLVAEVETCPRSIQTLLRRRSLLPSVGTWAPRVQAVPASPATVGRRPPSPELHAGPGRKSSPPTASARDSRVAVHVIPDRKSAVLALQWHPEASAPGTGAACFWTLLIPAATADVPVHKRWVCGSRKFWSGSLFLTIPRPGVRAHRQQQWPAPCPRGHPGPRPPVGATARKGLACADRASGERHTHLGWTSPEPFWRGRSQAGDPEWASAPGHRVLGGPAGRRRLSLQDPRCAVPCPCPSVLPARCSRQGGGGLVQPPTPDISEPGPEMGAGSCT